VKEGADGDSPEGDMPGIKASSRPVKHGRVSELSVTDCVRSFSDDDLRELMQFYRPLLREIIRRRWDRRLQRRLDPSDAVQSTWISVAKSVGRRSFVDRNEFSSYLIKVLCNQLESFRRMVLAQRRAATRDLGECDFPFDNLPDVPDEGMDVLDEMIRLELLQDVMSVILKFPRELQRLMRWRFRKGLTYVAIGAKIGRSGDEVRYLVDQCVRDICRQLPAAYSPPRRPR
jgi:RNA polymerase sigma factor (sigma-70 family)